MIAINNLTKRYGKQTIFDCMNFTFPDSGLVCILGASGCGKSTLLNMIAGFDSDYSGEISVFDTNIDTMTASELCDYRRDNIGFVFQNYNLIFGYTVLENILTACELNSNSNAQNIEKANVLLKRLGLSEKVNEKIQNLSGGQKQRVAIARALINDPSIILADEPTGALDRKNATEIMALLKEISKDRLVLVITHDKKICEFSDKVISITDGKIIGEENPNIVSSKRMVRNKFVVKAPTFRHGLKNFKVHILRYVAVSLAISIGVLAFILSLSMGNIMDKSITDFKEKNTAFNNGYVKIEDSDKVLSLLKGDERVENVYPQYVIKNVTLAIDKKEETMAEKYPMPKATEAMSYGVMPKKGENKIALSPSLAKKFQNDIDKLIGKELVLKYGETEYRLTICGIFNAGYDDFFVSSDIEEKFYQDIDGDESYSVSYDVKSFEDIASINQMLSDQGIEAKTAVKEVMTLQSTFENLQRLFLIVSILILAIGLFISIILLVKLQNSRYREIGLLSALGFSKKQILAIVLSENILLSGVATTFNAALISMTYLVSSILGLDLIITVPQILISTLSTGIIVILISILVSHKLVQTEPAVALRK